MRARYFIFSTLLMLSERWTIKTEFFFLFRNSCLRASVRARSTTRNAVSIRSECMCVCVHATHDRSVDAHTRNGVYHRCIGIRSYRS